MFQMRLFIIYPTDICQCHKISAKLNNVQNINIFLFLYSLSLTGLKLCSWAR